MYCLSFGAVVSFDRDAAFKFNPPPKRHVRSLSFRLCVSSTDLYCTLEVDSFGYFVSKAKTRVFRDTTEPQWNEVSLFHQSHPIFSPLVVPLASPVSFAPTLQQEFEIELEGSQCLRILCYEKCYDKSKLNKDDNEIVDKIMGKGQVQVGGTVYISLVHTNTHMFFAKGSPALTAFEEPNRKGPR